MFTFVCGCRQSNKCDVLFSITDTLKHTKWMSFISNNMRSSITPGRGQIKRLSSTWGLHFVASQLKPATCMHVCNYILTPLHQINRSAAIHKRHEWNYRQRCSQQRLETIKEDASPRLQPAARKFNVIAHTRASVGEKKTITIDQENVVTRAHYLSFCDWFKRGVERHHPFQHFCRLKH